MKGILENIIDLIEELYTDSVSVSIVRFNEKESEPFQASGGVKQVWVLSPLLFLILLDSVRQQTNTEDKFHKLATNASAVGLKMSVKKTKLLRIGSAIITRLTINNEVIDDAE